MNIPDHVARAALRLLEADGWGGLEEAVHLRDVIENQDRTIIARDMRLGDVVELVDGMRGGFGTMVVEKTSDEGVTLFRPYVHLGDIRTAHAECFMGVEHISVGWGSTVRHQLIRRSL